MDCLRSCVRVYVCDDGCERSDDTVPLPDADDNHDGLLKLCRMRLCDRECDRVNGCACVRWW